LRLAYSFNSALDGNDFSPLDGKVTLTKTHSSECFASDSVTLCYLIHRSPSFVWFSRSSIPCSYPIYQLNLLQPQAIMLIHINACLSMPANLLPFSILATLLPFPSLIHTADSLQIPSFHFLLYIHYDSVWIQFKHWVSTPSLMQPPQLLKFTLISSFFEISLQTKKKKEQTST
jgi:hypothetical protein